MIRIDPILACPLCRGGRRRRRFNTLRDLNAHLTVIHGAQYRIEIPSERDPPRIVPKRGAPRASRSLNNTMTGGPHDEVPDPQA